MPITPRTPAGTLELLPREQMVFQHMLDVIRRGFERFGFVPIETPVFELKDVLLTKSGGETEKQVYFVQSTGGLQQGHEPELALRFDLTVPLARYVAEHERELAFPFRRYQIQRVYRGERAQRGRFREFYQCDIDVIGKDKLHIGYDAEIPAIIVQIFEELKIGDFTIHFSNRKILRGLLAGFGVTDAEKQGLILREIDKLDKIGAPKVRAATIALGLREDGVDDILKLIAYRGTNREVLALLDAVKSNDLVFHQGLKELRSVVYALDALGVSESRARVNLGIARGLDYYTGTVYETLIDAYPELGSICSGGRYDELASHYTKSKLPGVGISIGLTRLFDQLNTHKLLPIIPTSVQIIIIPLDTHLEQDAFSLGAELRACGFNVHNHWEDSKVDKKLKYADKTRVPLAILMGTEERNRGAVIVKDLATKTQAEVPRGQLVEKLRGML